jgi:hypothetical protein
MKRIAGLFAGFLFAVLITALPSAADALTLSPPSYDYSSANRGDVFRDVVKIYNETSQEVTLYPAAMNFTYKEGDETTGTPEWYPASEDPHGTGLAAWVTYDKSPIVVPPGGRANLPFSIDVPPNAPPGGHFGGILLSNQPPDDTGVVAIGSQVGVLLFMRVEGDVVEKANIAEFGFVNPQSWYNHLPVDLFVRFENAGNVHLRPTGNLFISDWSGRQVKSIQVNEEFRTVLPKSIRKFNMSWVKKDGIENSSALYQEWVNFAIGKHKANLVLAYGTDNKLVTANATFYVWPWRIMLITILALVAIVFILTFGKRSWEKGVIKKYEKRQARRR